MQTQAPQKVNKLEPKPSELGPKRATTVIDAKPTLTPQPKLSEASNKFSRAGT
jgi:hypothetical protein